jgi:choline dehydrogenase-like flavoprotein
VRLGSRGDAVVELGYHEPADLVSLAAAFDFTQRVLGTGSMRALGPYHRRLLGIAGHGGSVPAGVPGFFPLDGTTEWERPTEVLRHATVTAHHLHGGCPMGGSADSDAVVDTRCRVHGIESLYVADVSIAPVPVRANTHLLALCVGERASDLVRG